MINNEDASKWFFKQMWDHKAVLLTLCGILGIAGTFYVNHMEKIFPKKVDRAYNSLDDKIEVSYKGRNLGSVQATENPKLLTIEYVPDVISLSYHTPIISPVTDYLFPEDERMATERIVLEDIGANGLDDNDLVYRRLRDGMGINGKILKETEKRSYGGLTAWDQDSRLYEYMKVIDHVNDRLKK